MSVRLSSLFFSIFFILSSNIAHSAPLEIRYGGQAFYDPNTNLTWYANANPIGEKTQDEARDWASNFELGGATNWSLPLSYGGGYNQASCEAGNYYYCEYFEFSSLYNDLSIRDNNPGLFTNLSSGNYWTGDYGYNPYGPYAVAYKFSFDNTSLSPRTQFPYFASLSETGTALTLVRHAGDVLFGLTVDVSAVPLPAAAWMFGSAVLGFVGLRRRKKQASL